MSPAQGYLSRRFLTRREPGTSSQEATRSLQFCQQGFPFLIGFFSSSSCETLEPVLRIYMPRAGHLGKRCRAYEHHSPILLAFPVQRGRSWVGSFRFPARLDRRDLHLTMLS